MLYESKLKQYVSKYQNPDITKRDVSSVLEQYKCLSPNCEEFVFNDGTKRDLLNLEGTIPVTYRGSVYNIPICIWIMDTHPFNAPMCFVKPTADMQIKVSRFVDHNGKIYLPYLHDWAPNHSDLLGLIHVLIVTFGEQPPVYSKPRLETAAGSAVPYPAHGFMGPRGSVNSGTTNNMYPPYPHTAFPPYPVYPPPTNQPFMPYPATSYPYSGNYPGYPPYPTQPSSAGGAPGSAGTGTITEEHIRASLLSAVEDKLRRRLKEQFSQGQAELDTLRRTHQELTQGKTKLEEILGKLEKEQEELDKNITILKDKEQELEKAIARLSQQEAVDVDEAVTTTAPLYKQLLNAFAEEAAIEDAIYYMGEALRRGVIDLDVFLKQVRALSRKQFMLRALMHKCRQKAGLAG